MQNPELNDLNSIRRIEVIYRNTLSSGKRWLATELVDKYRQFSDSARFLLIIGLVKGHPIPWCEK